MTLNRPRLGKFGAERLLWGSNFPMAVPDYAATWARFDRWCAGHLSEAEAGWLAGGTSAALFPAFDGPEGSKL
jgi:predicted TIM-barrel fold metal-dependent hydrolase